MGIPESIHARKKSFFKCLAAGCAEKAPLPGAVIAVQTFGDFLGFNSHCHILLTDGCFYGDKGMSRALQGIRVAPPLELKKLDAIFRHKVFRMRLNRGKITKEMIAMLG